MLAVAHWDEGNCVTRRALRARAWVWVLRRVLRLALVVFLFALLVVLLSALVAVQAELL